MLSRKPRSLIRRRAAMPLCGLRSSLHEQLEPRLHYSATVYSPVGPAAGPLSDAVLHLRSASVGLPAGWTGQDIGAVGVAGSASQSSGKYTIKGAGANIGSTADAFQFVSQSLTGNGQIIARLVSLTAADSLARAGLMFRVSTSAGSAMGFVGMYANGSPGYRYRASTNATAIGTSTAIGAKTVWFKLVRSGNTLTGYRSSNGTTWTKQDSATVSLSSTVMVGLAVTAYNKTKLATGVFDNVSVTAATTVPPPPPPPPVDPVPAAMRSNDGFVPLFDGKDLNGFYTYIDGKGKNNDPQGFFKAENGMLHVLGMGQTNQTEPFGYLATNNSYSNYRIRFQYKWGTTKFAPRNVAPWKRDSGLLTSITGADRVWPTCLEVQIQEGDVGDLWVLDTGVSATGTTTVASTSTKPYQYALNGTSITTPAASRLVKLQTVDSLTDWNTVDVIVEGGSTTVMVNGTVVNRMWNLKGPDGSPITQGRIAFQAEGAEVWYKDIQIKSLASTGTNLPYKVLVLAKPNATGDSPSTDVATALGQLGFLGSRNGFNVDVAVDSSAFTSANLANYSTVVFLETDGIAQLNDAAKAAFEQYILGGGGFVGIDAAPQTVIPPPPPPPPAPPPPPIVFSGPALELVDSSTDLPIRPFGDNDVIDLNTTGSNLNISADAMADTVAGSMVFTLDGTLYSTQDAAPFALAGVVGTDFADWTPTLGAHQLDVAEYSGPDATGDLLGSTTVHFTVVQLPPPPPPPPPTPIWPFLENLIGATVDARTPATALSLTTSNRSSSATYSLPTTWAISDAIETYHTPPTGVTPLLSTSATPVSWTRTTNGRVFYTALGSTDANWSDPQFLFHLLGGIEFAANASRLAPNGATVLFDGSSTSTFQKRTGGGAIGWTSSGGELTVVPGTGDIRSNKVFTGDFRLHLEFNVPAKLASVTEQDRGNSGVGLAGSYELQVLDSYGRALADKNDVGAIYGIKDADLNAALPAGAWESYDVLFTAPVWNGTTKVKDARVTAWLNGILVQNNVDVPTSTFTFDPEKSGGGPLILQDHNNAVKFRNIWAIDR